MSKSRTSPVVGAGGAGGAGVEVRGAAEEGAGEGYAKNEFSDDGERAQIAERLASYDRPTLPTLWIRTCLNRM